MMICEEFEGNVDNGFKYSLADLSALAYSGDRNLRHFVSKWDTILADFDIDKIGARTLARMFESKLMSSKLLEGEIHHFLRLPEGHADKTYQWLRDMIDKILPLERKDRNQANLQAANCAPIGGHPSAAATGKEGKRKHEEEEG